MGLECWPTGRRLASHGLEWWLGWPGGSHRFGGPTHRSADGSPSLPWVERWFMDRPWASHGFSINRVVLAWPMGHPWGRSSGHGSPMYFIKIFQGRQP